MSSFEEKLSKMRQGYNEKLGIDDKKQMEEQAKKKSALEKLRELFNFGAPPPAEKKTK